MAGITVNDSLFINEQSAAQTDVAGQGQIWVKDSTPNELWFTDDAGNDTQLGTGVGFSSRCRVYRSSNQSVGASWTKIQFDVENYDNNNEYDSTTNYRFTADQAGYYHVAASIRWVGATRHIIVVRKNGYDAMFGDMTTSTGESYSPISGDLYLDAGDYIEVYGYCTTTLNAAAGQFSTYMSIHRFA